MPNRRVGASFRTGLISLASAWELRYTSGMMYRSILICVTVLMFAGCCSHETVGIPSLLHPGDIDSQRAKMERFDPLPQTGFGPNVDGGRGRGFENAMAPERRASLYTETLLQGSQ
ncbi:MAG: hypothetical protein ACRC46_00530 [Thermoguttaceae bacterium]